MKKSVLKLFYKIYCYFKSLQMSICCENGITDIIRKTFYLFAFKQLVFQKSPFHKKWNTPYHSCLRLLCTSLPQQQQGRYVLMVQATEQKASLTNRSFSYVQPFLNYHLCVLQLTEFHLVFHFSIKIHQRL